MKQFQTIRCAILVLSGIATAAPIEKQTPEGGLAGFGTPSEHVHGENCVSAADRAHQVSNTGVGQGWGCLVTRCLQ